MVTVFEKYFRAFLQLLLLLRVTWAVSGNLILFLFLFCFVLFCRTTSRVVKFSGARAICCEWCLRLTHAVMRCSRFSSGFDSPSIAFSIILPHNIYLYVYIPIRIIENWENNRTLHQDHKKKKIILFFFCFAKKKINF